MNENSIVRKKGNFQFVKLDNDSEDYIAFPYSDNSFSLSSPAFLSATAVFIYNQINEAVGTRVQQIVEKVYIEYEIDPKDAYYDVVNCISEFSKIGMVAIEE